MGRTIRSLLKGPPINDCKISGSSKGEGDKQTESREILGLEQGTAINGIAGWGCRLHGEEAIIAKINFTLVLLVMLVTRRAGGSQWSQIGRK